ncbi:MAG: SWIM zinc finger family protein [Acidobacteria bacterium]|nr:SWIM zinc finger family protein [Acidobacteriota bacterium]
MMNIDERRMDRVIQEAFKKVSGSRRWQIAIAKAKHEIDSNPFMHFSEQTLLILSSSGEIYSANGACQCKAFSNGQPCWHRAAARLVQRYNEKAH